MRIGLDRAKIVERDDLDVLAADSAMARSALRPIRPNALGSRRGMPARCSF
jgi:hypothetical protein